MPAATFRNIVPAEELPVMLGVYNRVRQTVFIVGISLGALAAIASCFIEFKSVKMAKIVLALGGYELNISKQCLHLPGMGL